MKKKKSYSLGVSVPKKWYCFFKREAEKQGLSISEYLKTFLIVPFLKEKGFFDRLDEEDLKYMRIEGETNDE